MNKILVTGGAGFIGSNLVKLLVEKGFSVRVLDNFSTGHEINLKGFPVEIMTGDIRNEKEVDKAVEGVDTVFNLAASVGRQKSLSFPRQDSEVNVIGTINILEAVRKFKVGCLVHTSSAATFGEIGPSAIGEDHPQIPDSPYGVSKLAGEKMVLCYGELYNIRVVCLRYFNVYGVNQRFDTYGNVIPIFANRVYRDQPMVIYGDGKQTRDFVNAKDVAMINSLAAEKAASGKVYNVGSGTSIQISELANLMKDVSKKRISVVYEPARPADVLHCSADISLAKRELGFSPSTNIHAGLEEYYEWFKKDKETYGN